MILHIDKDLTLEEMGLYATMVNLPSADYTSAEYLATLSTDNVDKIKDILSSLIAKGYVLSLNDKFAVNKETIPHLAGRC